MTNLAIPDDLAEKIQAIAQHENLSIAEFLAGLIKNYSVLSQEQQRRNEALLASVGMFDDDITDLSSTVRETMDEFWRKRHTDI
ncbi:MAG: hypothetical protein BroJett018_46710 [Chloroflexota bacterium]|nr:MAG: hypothetical protein BroJett018_46710 [Chloroflexota bacterium]